METQDIYNELREMLCNQDKALKELVWTIARNKKLNRPKNVLLVGEVGTGKSTMVECTANKMNIPVARVTGFLTPQGTDPIVLYNAFTSLFVQNNKESFKGIVLIQDMKDIFLYGGFATLSSIINSGIYTYENRVLDISETMFIGEIDNNDLEDCFIEKPVYTLDNIDEAIYSAEYNGDEVREIIADIIDMYGEEDNNVDMYVDQYREAIRKTFLSPACTRVFNKKIFMDVMGVEDIKKAIESPVSELQTYSDDLCAEYMTSQHFINSVANHISESLVGLHDLDDAVRDVSLFDSKRKIKVYKENSLMRF